MAATIELYANNAYSILANSISDSVTTINIAPGTGSRFPSPTGNQFFRLTITGATSPNSSIEIVYVTSRSTDALTVIRGREGTVAQSWSVNDLCANEPTKEMFNQFMQPYVGIDVGTTNAYVVNTPQHEANYYTGMPVVFTTINANTTTVPTLNLNGLGIRTIQSANGGLLAAGDIQANTPIYLLYSATNNAWLVQSPIGYQRVITGGASSIVTSNLSVLRALISDAAGKVGVSATTSQELSYLAGVTSGIQSQLDFRPTLLDFESGNSGSNNGWQEIAGGLIIQWGSISIGSIYGTATFPVVFPNQCIRAYAVEGYGAAPGTAKQPTWYGVDTGNTGRFSARIYALEYIGGNWVYPTSSTQIACNWFAIGN